mgnify:CR=1 FL=1
MRDVERIYAAINGRESARYGWKGTGRVTEVQCVRDVLMLHTKCGMHGTGIDRLARGEGKVKLLQGQGAIAGTITTWFLLGGDLYTAYTFVQHGWLTPAHALASLFVVASVLASLRGSFANTVLVILGQVATVSRITFFVAVSRLLLVGAVLLTPMTPSEAPGNCTCPPVLPAAATTELIFRHAKTSGVQVRGVEVRRESVEVAFLRVRSENEKDEERGEPMHAQEQKKRPADLASLFE